MVGSPHYKELLLAFNSFEVEFLVVGGYAVMKYTEPRYTKDLDIWVSNSVRNAAQTYLALTAFGAPLQQDGITPETFTKDKLVYQIGVAPVRIDVTTHVDGITFAEAWPNRVNSTFFGAPVFVISRQDLLINKRATGRSSDLLDAEAIEKN